MENVKKRWLQLRNHLLLDSSTTVGMTSVISDVSSVISDMSSVISDVSSIISDVSSVISSEVERSLLSYPIDCQRNL